MSKSQPQVVRDLEEMVRTPSVNPDEGAMASLVAAKLDEIGAAVELVESSPGRTSVGARLGSGREGPRLVLNGHLDTVPIGDPEAWSHDPFGAEIEGGLLYGRGSCDMKAGLAVMLDVARRLAASERELRGELVLQFAIGEERAEPGTSSLIAAGFGGEVGVVVEPTGLRVATAQRGGGAFEVLLRGRGGHASAPEAAINPIAALAAVLAVISEHDGNLRRRSHPLLPGPSLVPTVLAAGEVSNTIPTTCSITCDRRFLPGETVAAEFAELRELLPDEVEGARVELVAPARSWPSSDSPERTGFAELVRSQASAAGAEASAEPFGTPYASDVGFLVAEGKLEAVTFGPGDISQAHTADECVDLDEVVLAARALSGVAETLLLV